MRTYSVAVLCGPTLVNRLATWLHDFPMNVTEGTERVYFKVDASGALEARFAALDIIKQFSDTFSLRDISATEGAA